MTLRRSRRPVMTINKKEQKLQTHMQPNGEIC